MEWLNYHHLHYFWVVAREGSIVRASAALNLAQPTISGQIHELEDVLGEKLFSLRGRRLVLTDLGHLVFGYADEIFSLGSEMLDAVRGRGVDRPVRLFVGIAATLPKFLVHQLLLPALRMGVPLQLVCREDRVVEEFLGDLAQQELDLVLSDRPAGPAVKARAFNHLLGECGTTFLASPALARAHRGSFPRSLDGAPLLLPTPRSTLRRALDGWFDARKIQPRVAGEFDDAELMHVFGQEGAGIFAVATVFESVFRFAEPVEVVGRSEAIRQQLYAISIERRLKNPAVAAICDGARKGLFAGSRKRRR